MTDTNNDKTSDLHEDPNPGAMLKAGREAAGMSAEDVAQKLYLKVTAVTALENNELDDSKSLTFTKGYVKNYARLVGLNVDDVIALFEQRYNRQQDTAKLQSFSKRVAKQAHDDRWMMVTYFILLVIIGGVVWWWLQQPEASLGEVTATTPVSTANSDTSPQSNAQLPVQTIINPVATNNSDAPAESEDDGQQPQLETPVPETGLVETVPNTENQNSTSVDDTADDTAVLDTDINELVTQPVNVPEQTQDITVVSVTFTFSDDCWVEIIDGTGEALAYGVKVKGYVMELEGVPPFAVTLGAPLAVSITYDGEPVDMSSISGNQIARLVLPSQE